MEGGQVVDDLGVGQDVILLVYAVYKAEELVVDRERSGRRDGDDEVGHRGELGAPVELPVAVYVLTND